MPFSEPIDGKSTGATTVTPLESRKLAPRARLDSVSLAIRSVRSGTGFSTAPAEADLADTESSASAAQHETTSREESFLPDHEACPQSTP